MSFKEQVRGALARRGYEVRRTGRLPTAERRYRVLADQGVDHVLDVGANAGQYASALRRVGYAGHITSFEPLPDAFSRLQSAAVGDPRWDAHNIALGDRDGDIAFHVSADGVCSSALNPTPSLTEVIPDARSIATIDVPVRRLDALQISDTVMLKIDTQGFERLVLDGATYTLGHVAILDLELAFLPLYDGGSSVYDLLPHVHDLGFTLMSMDPGFTDPRSGQLLDADFLFTRRDAAGA